MTLTDYDARYLLHQIEYVSQQKPKNFFAYLKKAIQEDYAKSELAEEQEKAEQERIERLVQQELEKLVCITFQMDTHSVLNWTPKHLG